MKIMVVAPGKEIHSNNWATAMCNRGHEVHYVTQDPFLENDYSFVGKVDKRYIIHYLPFHGKKGFLFNAVAIKRLTHKINPDVIHVHHAAGYGFLGTFTDRKKAFVSIYGWEVYDLVKNKLWNRMVHYVLKWYKHIGSTSKCMKEQTYKVFPDLKTKIAVTPFGIDMSLFKYEPVEKDEIIVGTVKKLDKKYGIEYLVRGFAKAYNELFDENSRIADKLYLELVGPGRQTDELKQLAKDLGISDRVRFIGKVSHYDVPKWLNRFDVYSAPSLTESFGVAVIEASACKTPVVVSDVGGLPEVVVDGETGFIVPAKNADALAKKIKELIVNPALRSQMGSAGEKFVRETYDWEKCVDLMEKIFFSIQKGTYASEDF